MDFIKGIYIKLQDKHLRLYENTGRDTLIAVEDIRRIRACDVDIYPDYKEKKSHTEKRLVCTTIDRTEDNRGVSYYVLTDPLDVIASKINRAEEDLAVMLLEIELKE